jgi:hypothetical protein
LGNLSAFVWLASGWKAADIGRPRVKQEEVSAAIEDKKPKPAKSGSRQVLNTFSPLAFHAGARI